MDDRRFDSLAKSLAAGRSRRGLLAATLGAVTAALTGGNAGAATLRRPGELCRKHGECASNVCGPKDASGRQRCQCTSTDQCPTPANKCLKAVCEAGACVTVQAVTCTAIDQCHEAGACVPSTGQCTNPPKANGASCSDGNACTENDTCQNGVCTPGAPKACEPCNACSGNRCRPVATDARCTQDHECVDGQCVEACKPVQADCDMLTNNCCQDEFTACSPQANSVNNQGEVKCCRIIGAACGVNDDCCEQAECVNGVCRFTAGDQCADPSECAGTMPDCCAGGICRDLASDTANCGACGNACPPPPSGGRTVCRNGSCSAECATGRTVCNGVCVRLTTDNFNCGACGNRCGDNQSCCSGQCRNVVDDPSNCGSCGHQCGPAEICCGRFCVVPADDPYNCGACGFACPDVELDPDAIKCCDGVCRNTDFDENHCNVCGNRCLQDHQCFDGVCLKQNF